MVRRGSPVRVRKRASHLGWFVPRCCGRRGSQPARTVGYGRLVKKHVLILGAGFGGLELATRLSESYGDAVRVTLLDRNDSFFFGFSKLEVMLGRQSSDDVRLY